MSRLPQIATDQTSPVAPAPESRDVGHGLPPSLDGSGANHLDSLFGTRILLPVVRR